MASVFVNNKYRGLRRGFAYKLLSEGRDYKEISVMGRPFFVPDFVFGESTDINTEEIDERLAESSEEER